MAWIESLRGTIVGLDTAPLIYFIEERPAYLLSCDPFSKPLIGAIFKSSLSVLTLTEVLVHPLRNGDRPLADQYRRILLCGRQVRTVPVSEEVAEDAAQLRSAHGLRTPDAIQLATAIRSGASSFLTNDSRLPKSIASLKLLILSRLLATNPS